MMNKKITIIIGIILLTVGAAYAAKAAGLIFLGINGNGLVLDMDLAQDSYVSSGKTFTDKSGLGNNGVSTNAATFSTDSNGKNTGAMSFNGTSDVISIPNSSSINISGSNITISGWINPSSCSNANAAFIHKDNQYTIALYNVGSVCKLTYGDSSNWSYATFGNHGAVSLNQWHHIVVTKDSSNIVTIYLDGVSVISKVFGGPIATKTSPLVIGSYPGLNFYSGLISKVSIYNQTLSAVEVQALYNSSKPKASAGSLQNGLIGHWALDGDGYNANTNIVTDKTPYGNYGTNSGATLTSDRMGQSNGAMSFNGSSWIDTGTRFATVGSAVTIATWVNPSTSQVQYADIWGNHSGTTGVVLQQNSGSLNQYSFTYGNGSAWISSGFFNLTANQWQLLVVTKDSQYCYIYINGIEQVSARAACPSDIKPSTGLNFRIAQGYAVGRYFQGSISDLRVYNRALSSDEILSLYGSYKPKIVSDSLQKGLVLDMPLTSKWTKTETAGSQIMTDKTPYSYDGQNYGGVVSAEGTLLANSGNRIATTFSVPNKEGTISIWYKPTYSSIDASRNSVLYTTGASWVPNSFEFALRSCCGTPYDNIIYMSDASNTNLRFEWDNPNWQANEWINLTVIYKSRNYIKPYFNGVLAANYGGPNTGDFVFPNTFNIGAAGAGGTTAKGTVSNLKVYDRMLSDTEIKSLYDKGR